MQWNSQRLRIKFQQMCANTWESHHRIADNELKQIYQFPYLEGSDYDQLQ